MRHHVHDPALESFARRALLERRLALIPVRDGAEADARLLYEERESDWRDRAANVTAAVALDSIVDGDRAELGRIATALDRLEDGSWGACAACHRPISEGRLRAVPEASECSLCAIGHSS